MNESAGEKWKRADVLGIVMAAYAMLLRSSPAALSSPRASGNMTSPRGNGIDLRRALRECLESPAKNKSFTFARICLIPSLNKSKSPSSDELFDSALLPCDVTEFLLSVLSEFGSQFLDTLSSSGECPVSRARWEQEMEEAVKVRMDQHQRQREFQGQFGGLSGPDTSGQAAPLAVDLLQRPDCMDDIIAFATAVCSLGPDYVLPFWSQEAHHNAGQELLTLVPSRALKILKRQMQKDESLVASYISFLGALALAENFSGGDDGAAIVHSILSIESNDPREMNWTSVVETLRLYVLALDPLAKTTTKSAKANLGKSSTAYYYLYDEWIPTDKTSSGNQNVDASPSPGPRELSPTDSFHLMSHLAIIANVAARSPSARRAIAAMNVPIFNPDKSVVGQDSAMMILFRLSLLPLHPDHRGAVFGTLATLLSMEGSTEDECAEMRKVAAGAWELLDQCQIIPIRLLEQYPSAQEAGGQNSASLLFPLSSTTAVRHGCTFQKQFLLMLSAHNIFFYFRPQTDPTILGLQQISATRFCMKWNLLSRRSGIILPLRIFCGYWNRFSLSVVLLTLEKDGGPALAVLRILNMYLHWFCRESWALSEISPRFRFVQSMTRAGFLHVHSQWSKQSCIDTSCLCLQAQRRQVKPNQRRNLPNGLIKCMKLQQERL